MSNKRFRRKEKSEKFKRLIREEDGEGRRRYRFNPEYHDFDYEKYPDINLHPKMGCAELERLGYDREIIEAIMGHNSATGVARKSKMAKTLFAVDELCGLIVALSKVRPLGFDGMSAESVEKALKKKEFAKNVSREDIEQGIRELDVKREEHFSLIVNALGKYMPRQDKPF